MKYIGKNCSIIKQYFFKRRYGRTIKETFPEFYEKYFDVYNYESSELSVDIFDKTKINWERKQLQKKIYIK